MVKMVEDKTVKGLLCLESDETHGYETWILYGKVEWNGVQVDVKAYLEDMLTDFESHEVEITIKSLKAPEGPK